MLFYHLAGKAGWSLPYHILKICYNDCTISKTQKYGAKNLHRGG